MNPAIVVTGASSGIGRELARVAAREGSALVLVARSREALESLAAELAVAGAQAHAVPIDLADGNAGEAIENALRERGLSCDVLVNSAGFGLSGRAFEIDRAEQMKLLAVNVCALTDLTLRFLPGMVARGRGGVLNLGSILGFTPGPGMAMYHASKAYVRSFTDALAAEVAGSGASVTNLSPGVVRTAFLEPLPIKHTWLFKAMPRSNASDTAVAGWRGFRAGRRLVIPRWVDRLLVMAFGALPDRFIPRLTWVFAAPPAAVSVPNSLSPAIVVTGAASGLGRELARIAAREGRTMVLIDRARSELESAAADLAKEGARAHNLAIDLAAAGAGEKIEHALREHGLYCDVLVNSAGIGLFGSAVEISRAEQMNLLAVNIGALTDLTLRFLPGMVARGRGGVLNLGSIAGYTSGPNMAAYQASKAYVRSFSAALATEVAGTGVTVTCLSPGFVRTAFFERFAMTHTRLFKLMPRANAREAAAAGWRGFRAGKRLVIPRLIDRMIAILLAVLPGRAIMRLTAGAKRRY
jgi:short-subunit dehydrogenase